MSEKPSDLAEIERKIAALLAQPRSAVERARDLGQSERVAADGRDGAIPYYTAVNARPTAAQTFVDSLGRFKDEALNMIPVVGTARQFAHAYKQSQEGDDVKALAHAIVGTAALPFEVMSFTGVGPNAALQRWRAGDQMPEQAARMMGQLSRGHIGSGIDPHRKMTPREIDYETDIFNATRRPSQRIGGFQDLAAPATPYEDALMRQQARRVFVPPGN